MAGEKPEEQPERVKQNGLNSSLIARSRIFRNLNLENAGLVQRSPNARSSVILFSIKNSVSRRINVPAETPDPSVLRVRLEDDLMQTFPIAATDPTYRAIAQLSRSITR
jgi:hypothetical protein